MSDKKPPMGFYREAVDIRHMKEGHIQIAPNTIIYLPKSGMYKMSTNVLLISADEDLPEPLFSEDEAEAMAKGLNVVDIHDGKPYDPEASEDEGPKTWGSAPANDNGSDGTDEPKYPPTDGDHKEPA